MRLTFQQRRVLIFGIASVVPIFLGPFIVWLFRGLVWLLFGARASPETWGALGVLTALVLLVFALMFAANIVHEDKVRDVSYVDGLKEALRATNTAKRIYSSASEQESKALLYIEEKLKQEMEWRQKDLL